MSGFEIFSNCHFVKSQADGWWRWRSITKRSIDQVTRKKNMKRKENLRKKEILERQIGPPLGSVEECLPNSRSDWQADCHAKTLSRKTTPVEESEADFLPALLFISGFENKWFYFQRVLTLSLSLFIVWSPNHLFLFDFTQYKFILVDKLMWILLQFNVFSLWKWRVSVPLGHNHLL